MKKLVLTLTATLACLGAFAQGKIGFQNDSVHLAYFNTADPAYGSMPVGSSGGPGGVNFVADLYMGTSAGALRLYATTSFGATPGKWAAASIKADGTTVYGTGTPGPAIASGSVFVEAVVHDSTSVSPIVYTGVPVGLWWGASQEFNFTLGVSVTYPVMWGANGNWAAGTQAVPGGMGAISVQSVPEPASFALAGLGAAMLVIFRRRK
jgi:hypothetical protein